MAVDDGHGLPVVANANTEVLEAPICLVWHKVLHELALHDLHSIGSHDRAVVPAGIYMERLCRSVTKKLLNPSNDVASLAVLRDASSDVAELAQAKYVQRMNFERFFNV